MRRFLVGQARPQPWEEARLFVHRVDRTVGIEKLQALPSGCQSLAGRLASVIRRPPEGDDSILDSPVARRQMFERIINRRNRSSNPYHAAAA